MANTAYDFVAKKATEAMRRVLGTKNEAVRLDMTSPRAVAQGDLVFG